MSPAPSAPADVLAAALAQVFQGDYPKRLGVAVSGGGDSMALMALVAPWGLAHGVEIRAASVDHGLRPEAAREAELAAAGARALGLSHDTLPWRDWDGAGNLQAAARHARLQLLSTWARKHALGGVCLAHTTDDQGETVVLRLARGSGVDGLSAMAQARRQPDGTLLLRPLLGCSRADLRIYLRAQGMSWAEDPSNQDRAYDRVRARELLADPPLKGLTSDNLAETALRMQAARHVLQQVAVQAAEQILAVTPYGAVTLKRVAYANLADETRWRIMAAVLGALSGKTYRPRFASLRHALQTLDHDKATSLHGCLIVPARAGIEVQREPDQVAQLRCGPSEIWDENWRITGACPEGAHIAALGTNGWLQLSAQERKGVPHRAARALPGLWAGADLLAAPGLRTRENVHFNLSMNREVILASMLSH